MKDKQKENEFLKQENYYQGYQEKIDDLKNNSNVIELDKLHYLVFRTDEGKKLLEAYKERYLLPGFVNPNNPNAQTAAMYFEGFKEAYRIIIGSIRSHEQRIEAENNKQ